jgi:hypothetical protein
LNIALIPIGSPSCHQSIAEKFATEPAGLLSKAKLMSGSSEGNFPMTIDEGADGEKQLSSSQSPGGDATPQSRRVR